MAKAKKEVLTIDIGNVYGKGTDDLNAFHGSCNVWIMLDKKRKSYRQDICTIGSNLNTLYDKAIKAGFNREQIPKLISKYYHGIRSDQVYAYRKFADSVYDIEPFIKAYGIKSSNVKYCLTKFNTHVSDTIANNKEAIAKKHAIENDLPMLTGKRTKIETPASEVQGTKANNRVTDIKLKEGIDPDTGNPMTPIDFAFSHNCSCNELVKRLNDKQFNKEQLDDFERLHVNILKQIKDSQKVEVVLSAVVKTPSTVSQTVDRFVASVG